MARPDVRPFRRQAHIALFEATSLVAKGIKDHLAGRSFPAASVRLYTSIDDPDVPLSEYAGEAMLVARPDLDAMERVDIAFLCGTEEEGERYLDWPDRAGFTAIDLSSASYARNAPLINMEVNPEAIAPGAGLIAAPGPIAHLLSSLLAPIRRGPGLTAAMAVVFQPASECGEAGIEELHRQSAGLLNFQDMPKEVFGDQLAFNLLPAFLYPGGRPPGGSRPDRLAGEVGRIAGTGYDLSVEVVLAPVFHCHAALLLVTLPGKAGRKDLEGALRGAAGVVLARPGDRPTPVGRAGREGILVAGIRPAGGAAFWLWAIADHLAGGAALNAVRIAETLLERGLRRRPT